MVWPLPHLRQLACRTKEVGWGLLFLVIGTGLIFPLKISAKKFVVDPVGTTTIIAENDNNCLMRWWLFREDGSSRFDNFLGRAEGGMLTVVFRRLPLALQRGEMVNFGYEPIPEPHRECPEHGLITMDNEGVVVEELPYEQPNIGGYWYRNPNYRYWRITFPDESVKLHVYTLPWDPQPEYVQREVYYPVIFIHGLDGRPEDWVDGNKKIYWEMFQEKGYPEELLATYAYADADGDPQTYDYQGDVTKIDDDLPGLVEKMAQRYEEKYGMSCGDQCVDLVGFSLGGIVARQYLNEHPVGNKIRKVVTIGTPHRGVPWLGVIDRAELLPGVGGAARRAIIDSINKGAILRAAGLGEDQVLDLRSDAALQMRPASEFLGYFNSVVYGSKLAFQAIAGDIDLQLSQNLFHFKLLSSRISLGDGIVDVGSAVGVPAMDITQDHFSDKTRYIQGTLLLVRAEKTYKYTIDLASADDLRYFHLSLPKQPEVVQQVLDFLRIR